MNASEVQHRRESLAESRHAQGKKGGMDCDEFGCDRTVQDGVLWRVNPKGEPGIFMCGEHAKAALGMAE